MTFWSINLIIGIGWAIRSIFINYGIFNCGHGFNEFHIGYWCFLPTMPEFKTPMIWFYNHFIADFILLIVAIGGSVVIFGMYIRMSILRCGTKKRAHEKISFY